MNGIGRGGDKEKKSKASIITRETVGMTFLLFSAVLFLIAVTGKYVFGSVGTAITAFLLGIFGFLAYPLLILVFYLSIVLTFQRKWIPAKWLVRFGLVVLAVFLIVHTATSVPRFTGAGYGAYLSACWSAASVSAAQGTGGGLVLGVIVYPVQALLSGAGAYVFFALLLFLSLFFVLMGTPFAKYIKRGKRERGERPTREGKSARIKTEGTRAYPVAFDDVPVPERRELPKEEARPAQRPVVSSRAGDDEYERSRSILFRNDPALNYRNNLIFDHDSYFNTHARRSTEEEQPAAEQTNPVSYSNRFAQEAQNERAAMPKRVTHSAQESSYSDSAADDFNYPQTPSYRAPEKKAEMPARDFYENDVQTPEQEEPAAPAMPEPPAQEPVFKADEELSVSDREAQFRSLFRSAPRSNTPRVEPEAPSRSSFILPEEPVRRAEPETPRSFILPETPVRRAEPEAPARDFEAPAERDDEPIESTFSREEDSRVFGAPVQEERRSNANLFDDDDDIDNDADYREEPPVQERARRTFSERTFRREEPAAPVPQEPIPAPKKHVYRQYVRPSADLLRHHDDTVSVSQEEVERNCAIIVDTLAGFRVDAEVVKVTSGSSVTRYDIDIPRNISVRTVTKHDQEIAMRLHARDGVNIYGNSEVGAISIEVPNSVRATVGLKSVLQAEEYLNSKPTALMFAIGKDVEGRNVCGNIVKMKHVLVAGSTGSGKSVCLNAMLISLICKYSPEDLRLILIDPKKVEFAIYDGLPHLIINEIIADAQKAVAALNWSIKEMERRYLLFEQKTRSGRLVHNVDEYNAGLDEGEEKLPKIVIVVDELADLMSVAKKDIEDRIQRLAQKARAAGIHLIIATQRPSVDVITGVIKGNLPTRIAFRVIQEVDSRTIIDTSGAEKLLGNGDMLYRTEGMFNCSRVQGAFLSSEEVQAVIEDVKRNNEAYFDQSVADYINKTQSQESDSVDGDDDGGEIDPQYIKALAIVVKVGSASISLIQRKCSVGYNHAGKIIEWMELMGYISPFDGKAKARTVLLTKEEFESKYGSLD